jgi:hypothetical protein
VLVSAQRLNHPALVALWHLNLAFYSAFGETQARREFITRVTEARALLRRDSVLARPLSTRLKLEPISALLGILTIPGHSNSQFAKLAHLILSFW